MYIVSLILAILAFISAFLPLYGIIAVIIFGLISVTLSIINYNSDVKKIKESAIISIIIVVISALICYGINKIYGHELLGNNDDISYSELVKDYPLYSVNDVIEDEYSKIQVSNISYDGDLVIIEFNASFLDTERYFSSYDFYIMDTADDLVYFPKYESNNSVMNGLYLEKGEEASGTIKFDLNSNASSRKLYLVYDDGKSMFKIQL